MSRFMPVTRNLQHGMRGPLPPVINSASRKHAGTCCMWKMLPLSEIYISYHKYHIFESSDFDCCLKLGTVVFFPHSVGCLVMILNPFLKLFRVPYNFHPFRFLAKIYFRKFHNCTFLYGEVWHRKPDVRLASFSSFSA